MVANQQNNLQDEIMFAGDYKPLEFKLFQEDGITPLDLTGCTIIVNFSLWDKNYKILTKTGTISDVNKFIVVLESADTLTWDEAYYAFQPVITDLDGKVHRDAEGKLYIKSAIQ